MSANANASETKFNKQYALARGTPTGRLLQLMHPTIPPRCTGTHKLPASSLASELMLLPLLLPRCAPMPALLPAAELHGPAEPPGACPAAAVSVCFGPPPLLPHPALATRRCLFVPFAQPLCYACRLVIGFFADRIGRKYGSITTASIMCLFGILIVASSPNDHPNNMFVMFTVVQALFGIGVGG